MKSGIIERLKQRAARLKRDIYALYLACRDPRVPWHVRVMAWVVIAYALSPVDLIPDPIPILGYLDDLILIPLGVLIVIKMIPPQVLKDCREQAQVAFQKGMPKNWIAGGLIIMLWILLFAFAAFYVSRFF